MTTTREAFLADPTPIFDQLRDEMFPRTWIRTDNQVFVSGGVVSLADLLRSRQSGPLPEAARSPAPQRRGARHRRRRTWPYVVFIVAGLVVAVIAAVMGAD